MKNVRVLIRKELRLQRTNLLFTAAVGLVWLLMLGFALFPNKPLAGHKFTAGNLAQGVLVLFVLPCLYGLLPLTIGASAVAEERRLDTLDWQLAQPAPRWRQWVVKAEVAMGLALLIGVAAAALDWIMVGALRAGQGYTSTPSQSIGPAVIGTGSGLQPAFY